MTLEVMVFLRDHAYQVVAYANHGLQRGVPMTLTSVLPLIAAALFIVSTVSLSRQHPHHGSWRLPAIGSLLFFLFSLYATLQEGLGFWAEHTRNLWGNQIWFDLLLAAGIAWSFIVPAAREMQMRLLPWLALVVGTGCIGLLAMVARLIYLQEQKRGAGLHS
jgi:hypothetical protein